MKFLTTTLLMLFSIAALAQQNIAIDTTSKFRDELFKKGKVAFGLKAGYTNSNLYGSEIDYIFADNKTDWLSGFHAGIVVNTQVNNYFWLKYELIFNQRGAGVIISDSFNGSYSSKMKTYYLDLYPVSPTFHFKGLQIYAGPYLSTLTAATIQRKDELGNFYRDKSIFGDAGNDESEKKYLQKFDFGFNAGIEYQFQFGLLIGAKYTHGFTDLFQYANSYTLEDTKTDNIKICNRSVMFSIGYVFSRKG